MPETAEALAALQTSRRNVTIEVCNLSRKFCLIDPKVYLDSGCVHSPPAPTIRPLKTELCNFNKTAAKASGTAGVMTYDLLGQGQHKSDIRIAIMFSVPNDRNVYKNWCGLALYDGSKECDKGLFKEMYYEEQTSSMKRLEATGCELALVGNGVEIKATMSPLGRSIMKVELWEDVFGPPMFQQH